MYCTILSDRSSKRIFYVANVYFLCLKKLNNFTFLITITTFILCCHCTVVTTVISVQAQFLTDDTMMRVEKTRITPETIRIKTEEKKRNQVSRLLRRSHINVIQLRGSIACKSCSTWISFYPYFDDPCLHFFRLVHPCNEDTCSCTKIIFYIEEIKKCHLKQKQHLTHQLGI